MPISNAHLVRWRDGWRWVKDTASEGTWQRREAGLSLGNAQSPDEVDRVTAAIQVTQARPQVSTTIAIEPAGPGESPYTGFNVGDTVTAPDETGASVEMRVVGVTVKQDDAGNVIYVPELRFLRDEPERQLRRTTQRMTGGTVGGTVESATPAQSVAQGGLPSQLQGTKNKWVVWEGSPGTLVYGGLEGISGPGVYEAWTISWDSTEFSVSDGPGIDFYGPFSRAKFPVFTEVHVVSYFMISGSAPANVQLMAGGGEGLLRYLMPWQPGMTIGIRFAAPVVYPYATLDPTRWGFSLVFQTIQPPGASPLGAGALAFAFGGATAYIQAFQPATS